MEKIDCFFNLFTTFLYLKLKTFHSFFKFQRFKLNIELLKIQFQGGQNFYEKIRRKIRTFLEEIRTIFEKKSVQSVHFFKNPYYQYNFRKNPCNPYI